MALSSTHPIHDDLILSWEQLRHCYAGEKKIKKLTTRYLPPTFSQRLDGMNAGEEGWESYQSYLKRARFPNYVKRAVKQMVGVMHAKPPKIELPPKLDILRKRATIDGESLELLLRRINAEQLIVGRIGLLLDLPDKQQLGAAIPYICTYTAESVINWDEGPRDQPDLQKLKLVVLKETEKEIQSTFEWVEVEKYRVLTIAESMYSQAVFREDTDFDPAALKVPKVSGQPLDKIPFQFINTADLITDPSDPPLLELSDLSLTIYRGEADYRESLHQQAQDTLVIVTDDTNKEKWRTGQGATILVPTGGDAKYIGVSATGLPEQRQALENDRLDAKEIAGQMLQTTSRERESGEALKVRVASQTATLKEVALTGAEGLEAIVRVLAEWVGEDPEKVIIEANEDFAESHLTARDFMDLQGARKAGAPMSDESYHTLLRKQDWTEKEFKEEMALVEAERQRRMEEAQQQFGQSQPPRGGAPPGEGASA